MPFPLHTFQGDWSLQCLKCDLAGFLYSAAPGVILFARPLEIRFGPCLRVPFHMRKRGTGLIRVTTEELHNRWKILFWIRANSFNSHHLSFRPEFQCHEYLEDGFMRIFFHRLNSPSKVCHRQLEVFGALF